MSMETFYKELYVINVLKCNAFEHWGNIEVGEQLIFEVYGDGDKNVSEDFDFDKELIRVKLKKEQLIIGMLSKEESKFMKDIIRNGWTGVFKGVVCKVDKDAQYDQRISVAVYINEKTSSDCLHNQKK